MKIRARSKGKALWIRTASLNPRSRSMNFENARTTAPEYTRLEVNMNDSTRDALKELASEQGLSYTECIRRAVSVWYFFEQARKEGDEVILRGGRYDRRVIWP